ncbi:MAG: PilZ domain-containing protein, partial [Nitrospiraceae bacterium]|nr:PilZ domain-containing protein [Nitrospiraceae bacterium]
MDRQMSAFERYERGLVLKQVHMYNPAMDDFRKAALDPHYSGKAYVQMALCLRTIGRHEEAVMAFRQALASPLLTSDEQRHILYHMGQTLESLGRYAESVEVYGWIRKEDPGFRDVTERIKHLTAGGRGPFSSRQGAFQCWMKEVLAHSRRLAPHMVSFLEQTGEWVGLKPARRLERSSGSTQRAAGQHVGRPATPSRRSQSAFRDRTIEARQHVRVPVRMRSQFSSKGRKMSGEGELRDLSPWGCRVTSPVRVPVGENLECCIFPQEAENTFIIDGATVRWINAR